MRFPEWRFCCPRDPLIIFSKCIDFIIVLGCFWVAGSGSLLARTLFSFWALSPDTMSLLRSCNDFCRISQKCLFLKVFEPGRLLRSCNIMEIALSPDTKCDSRNRAFCCPRDPLKSIGFSKGFAHSGSRRRTVGPRFPFWALSPDTMSLLRSCNNFCRISQKCLF